LEQQQNFKNHTKVVPTFIFFVLPVLALNLGWTLNRWRLEHFSFGRAVAILTAAALLWGFLLTRSFALRVQDRVIRLEEHLRYARVLPTDLQARAAQLSLGQVVALRFASDEELPGLLRKVLEENLTERKAIKASIVHWRADHLRA
jgi:4-amino-4-deoxy-L-arabinose transferase-like glycosyltransferase